MSSYLHLSASLILNCLLCYLFHFHIGGRFRAVADRQTPLKAEAIKFAYAVVGIGVWLGSSLYFTLGAVFVVRLTEQMPDSGSFGDWRDLSFVANGLFSCLAIGFAATQLERKKKGNPASKQ